MVIWRRLGYRGRSIFLTTPLFSFLSSANRRSKDKSPLTLTLSPEDGGRGDKTTLTEPDCDTIEHHRQAACGA